MREGLQSFFKSAGKGAGLALCLIQVAEEVFGTSFETSEVVNMLESGVRSGLLFYNYGNSNDPQNFKVLNAVGFLSCLVLKKVSARYISDPVEIENYCLNDREYVVERFVGEDINEQAFPCYRRPSWDALDTSSIVKRSYVDKLLLFTVG
jgi:hypothetical protein